jgi:pantoate--beta-alanine ligase
VILIKKSGDLLSHISKLRAANLSIGFVPTMGALHYGHLSLIEAAKKKCDIVVCSIFVNPTQFNQESDLNAYPRTLENDIQLLLSCSCDILFHPEVSEMYGESMEKESTEDYGNFIHVLEGASRPGHFDGVVTVLRKLFLLVLPHQVFFGQKDYQQCLVVQTLIHRSFPEIIFHLCPIAREMDGLAMSSRNVRLTEAERAFAPKIFENLSLVTNNWKKDHWQSVLSQASINLQQEPFVFEYLSACDPKSLKELDTFQENAIILVAVRLGSTRLIDNLIIQA